MLRPFMGPMGLTSLNGLALSQENLAYIIARRPKHTHEKDRVFAVDRLITPSMMFHGQMDTRVEIFECQYNEGIPIEDWEAGRV